MRLRWKLNLFSSGVCAMGALFSAMAQAPYLLGFNVSFAILCWYIADSGIQKDYVEMLEQLKGE